MDPVLWLTAAGVGYAWWRFRGRRPPQARDFLDEDLEVVVHVAGHEAKARGQLLAPAHLLYGLLQDEGFCAAAARLGARVPAIEAQVFDGLRELPRSPSSWQVTSTVTTQVLQTVAGTCLAAGRKAGPIDLFIALLRVDGCTREACEAGGVRDVDLLFGMVHGVREADIPVPDGAELAVVLVNDDFSTMEHVVETLERDFGLETAAAQALMLRVHREGRGQVGRFPSAEARERARAATARARDRGFPLLVRLEP